MSDIDTTVKIGADLVDINAPCAVVAALRKVQLKLATGGLRETVRLDGEEVTFTRSNDTRLAKLIEHYARECARASGTAQRTRYAKRFRFT